MMALLFAGLTFAVVALAVHSCGQLRRIWLWMLLTGILAQSGGLMNFDSFPPPMMLMLMPALSLTTALCLTSSLGSSLSLSGLVAFQAFRLPLELVMHECARRQIMPPQMSFTGRNFDILTGLLAIPLAWAVARGKLGRRSMLAWNTMGLVLLFNVVGTAVASLPGPTRIFWHEPPNLWITHLPYVWLPSVLVPLALGGHLLIGRKLLTEK